jgi:hypothetical protein
VVFRRGRDEHRLVTVEEFRDLQQEAGAPPVVISHQQLSVESRRQMGIQLLYTSPHGEFWPDEDMYVYGDNNFVMTKSFGSGK